MINKRTKKDFGLVSAMILAFGIFYSGGYFTRYILERDFNSVPLQGAVALGAALHITVAVVLLYAVLQRRKSARALTEANRRNEDLINNIQGGVISCVYDTKTGKSKTLYISEGWTDLTGYTMQELDTQLGGNPQTLVLPEDKEATDREYAAQISKSDSYKLEYRLTRKDGRVIWAIDRGRATINADGIAQNLSIVTEVNEIKEKEEELRRMSRTDPLTGLNNKTAAIFCCQGILDKQKDRLHALLVLDIDDFKSINDNLGHIFGDTVLIEVSARLKRLFAPTDIIARVGGDEFIAFMKDISSLQMAKDKADEVCAAFQNTYMGATGRYKISCSVGIAYSTETSDYQEMFRRADIALYKAKNKGKNQYIVYTKDDEMEPTDEKRSLNQVELPEKDSGQLKLKERIFELLYSSVDFVGSINMALALLGRILDVDRTYIFEDFEEGNFFGSTYEWCAQGVAPKVKSQHLWTADEMKIFEHFDENGIFTCVDTAELSPDILRIAQAYGAKAFTQVAIMENGEICGIIGFDSISKKARPTKEQSEIMLFAAKVISVFILKKRAEDRVDLYNKSKMEALDTLPNRIYVIDKDFRLRYMNNITKAMASHAREGEHCYAAFMKNNAPCDNCPALKCKKNLPASVQMHNPYFNTHLIANASKTTWAGTEDMVLLCCQDVTSSQVKKQGDRAVNQKA